MSFTPLLSSAKADPLEPFSMTVAAEILAGQDMDGDTIAGSVEKFGQLFQQQISAELK